MNPRPQIGDAHLSRPAAGTAENPAATEGDGRAAECVISTTCWSMATRRFSQGLKMARSLGRVAGDNRQIADRRLTGWWPPHRAAPPEGEKLLQGADFGRRRRGRGRSGQGGGRVGPSFCRTRKTGRVDRRTQICRRPPWRIGGPPGRRRPLKLLSLPRGFSEPGFRRRGAIGNVTGRPITTASATCSRAGCRSLLVPFSARRGERNRRRAAERLERRSSRRRRYLRRA